MHITETSTHPSINAWLRTLAFDTFRSHEIFLQYLRWLDQSYGATVTCTFHADRSATIGIHGVNQITILVDQGRLCVRWLLPDTSYWATLQAALSKPDDVTQIHGGAWRQFYVDTRQDSYLLRDLTSHLHR
jgi:hypothetical protein